MIIPNPAIHRAGSSQSLPVLIDRPIHCKRLLNWGHGPSWIEPDSQLGNQLVSVQEDARHGFNETISLKHVHVRGQCMN